MIKHIIKNDRYSKDEIVSLLLAKGDSLKMLVEEAGKVKEHYVGNKVYFRGLIEYSNICSKNCYYCGVRCGNKNFNRYKMTKQEVFVAAKYAHENEYASIVIQAGERTDSAFINDIEEMLFSISQKYNQELRVTLSLGEQADETYQRWENAGSHRYLLRIETSIRELYSKLHPNDGKHTYDERVDAIRRLQKLGFQAGTGVMVGLPFQNVEHLADDILFFREMDIDMFGLGPYIEHEDTPLYEYRNQLWPKMERFEMSLKMVAVIRLMMKDVNIAATTAMQAIDPLGREKAITAGANVIMPNLTPVKYRGDYLLYEEKPCINEDASHCKGCLCGRIENTGNKVGFGEWGDSKHFVNRQKNKLK
jgi:biotin synthase